ncbi:MAG: hypothetical protein ACREOM_07235 [Candidatus Dormibacteraceae bacterium]
MTALPLLFLATVGGLAATVLFAFGVRRLLGLDLPLLRTLIAGVIAVLVESPIISALLGSEVTKTPSILPDLWFVILGVGIALLVGMTFLVA